MRWALRFSRWSPHLPPRTGQPWVQGTVDRKQSQRRPCGGQGHGSEAEGGAGCCGSSVTWKVRGAGLAKARWEGGGSRLPLTAPHS